MGDACGVSVRDREKGEKGREGRKGRWHRLTNPFTWYCNPSIYRRALCTTPPNKPNKPNKPLNILQTGGHHMTYAEAEAEEEALIG